MDDAPLANVKQELESVRNSRDNSNEENEEELDSNYGNGESFVKVESNQASSDEDESNYVYMDSPEEDDSSDDLYRRIKNKIKDVDEDYVNNGDDGNDSDSVDEHNDVDSVNESHMSTEEMDVKAEIDAMIESDLASEQCTTDEIGESIEIYLEEIDYDIDDIEYNNESIGTSRSVDSPASFSTISSRRQEARTLDVPEFINVGSYRADFDVAFVPPRPDSPLNLVNEQFEVQLCDFCADIFASRKMVRSCSFGAFVDISSFSGVILFLIQKYFVAPESSFRCSQAEMGSTACSMRQM